jgi:hypothetical protein
MPLVEWLKIPVNSDNVKYLPTGVSYDLSYFEDFMEKRQKLVSDEFLKKTMVNRNIVNHRE